MAFITNTHINVPINPEEHTLQIYAHALLQTPGPSPFASVASAHPWRIHSDVHRWFIASLIMHE